MPGVCLDLVVPLLVEFQGHKHIEADIEEELCSAVLWHNAGGAVFRMRH